MDLLFMNVDLLGKFWNWKSAVLREIMSSFSFESEILTLGPLRTETLKYSILLAKEIFQVRRNSGIFGKKIPGISRLWKSPLPAKIFILGPTFSYTYSREKTVQVGIFNSLNFVSAITSELGYIEDGVYQADENCKGMFSFLHNKDPLYKWAI